MIRHRRQTGMEPRSETNQTILGQKMVLSQGAKKYKRIPGSQRTAILWPAVDAIWKITLNECRSLIFLRGIW